MLKIKPQKIEGNTKMAKTTGLASIASGRSDMQRIDPRLLKIKEGWNNRDFSDPANIEHVQVLKASIKANGVREPLKAIWEQNNAFITNGECRLKAVMELIAEGEDIKAVPVIPEDRYANEADRLMTQIISNSGKPFTPLEMAKTFKKLIDHGWINKQIAEKAGISQARVSQILDLLSLPTEIQAMVTAGAISPTMAMNTVKGAEGNVAQATETLKAATVTARQEGSNRVLPRHVAASSGSAPRQTVKATVKEVFEGVHVEDDGSEDGVVVLRMTQQDWARLKDAAGIED